MKLEVGDLITVLDGDYEVLDIIPYGGINYAFVNKMNKEEPTDLYYAFKLEDNTVTQVVDKEMLEILVPIFSKNVNDLALKMLDEVKM